MSKFLFEKPLLLIYDLSEMDDIITASPPDDDQIIGENTDPGVFGPFS